MVAGGSVLRQLHQVSAFVANLLHRHQRLIPVDRPAVGHEMVVVASVVVVHVRRDDVLGDRLDRVGHVAHQVRMAEVEADAGARTVELLLEHRHERRRVRQAVRNHLDRDAHAERRRPAGRSLQGCEPPQRGGCRPGSSCSPAFPGAKPSPRTESCRAMPRAASRLTHRCLAPLVARSRRSNTSSAGPVAAEHIGNWRVDAVQRQVRFRQPARELGDRLAVAIVEVARVAKSSIDSKPCPAISPGDRVRAADRDRGAWKSRSAWNSPFVPE